MMSEELQANVQETTEAATTPEQPRHTRRHRSRKAQEQEPAQAAEDGRKLDVSQAALRRRQEIKAETKYTDPASGIRIVYENEIPPGEVSRRVRSEFDRKHPKEEREIVKREGFNFAGDVDAWVMPMGPKARELAKKAVNLVYKQRGLDTDPVRTPMAARF
jgi:hypothetical protein